jgi:hypothetical protein
MTDLFEGCFNPRDNLTPEQFGARFCAACVNPECSRSRLTRASWSQRISTQVDRLLDHPRFAPEGSFQDIRQMDFHTRQDPIILNTDNWPTQFRAAPPEPVVQPAPAQEIVFEKEVRSLRGGSEVYLVTRDVSGHWACNCKAFVYGGGRLCKHIQEVQSAPPEDPIMPEAPPPTGPLIRPPVPASVKGGNTPAPPQGGLVVGVGSPAAAPVKDPWAVTDKPKVIPVGGKIVLG